jgi:hypothetical protein
MGYSLLSQFQGSLLGVSLGLFWKHLTEDAVIPETYLHSSQPLTSSHLPHHCLNFILSQVNHLIADKGIVWEDEYQVKPTDQNLVPNKGQGQTSYPFPQPGCLAEIATLPLMLFFHENPCRLRQHLQQVVQLWQPQPLDTTVELLALGEAIAYLLQPSPDLQQLIPQMLTQMPPEAQLAQQLTQVSSLLQSGASLEAVAHHLMPPLTLPQHQQLNVHLAIAIYCFLSTPTAFSVSVRRAMRIHPESSLTCGITAALSGAYNGLPSLPTSWKLQLRRRVTLDSSATSHGVSEASIPIDQHILNQSTQLFQAWAGLYSPIHPDTNPLTSLIVAAPLSLPD